MGQKGAIRRPLDGRLLLEAKARQASKLAEIREALVAAGCDTIRRQAAALGLLRATAWAVLNRDNRVGPSANIIKRILSSPTLPRTAQRKVNEYIEGRINGLYGHSEASRRRFHDQLCTATHATTKRGQNHVCPAVM